MPNTTSTPATCCQSPYCTSAAITPRMMPLAGPRYGTKVSRPAMRPIRMPRSRPTAHRPRPYITPSTSITRNWPRRNAPSTSLDSRASRLTVSQVVARHQRSDALDQQVPVAQEEERDHRQQHDVGDQRRAPRSPNATDSPASSSRCRRRAPSCSRTSCDQVAEVEPVGDLEAGAALRPTAARSP